MIVHIFVITCPIVLSLKTIIIFKMVLIKNSFTKKKSYETLVTQLYLPV